MESSNTWSPLDQCKPGCFTTIPPLHTYYIEYNTISCIIFFTHFYFCGAGIQTLGLAQSRQELYQWVLYEGFHLGNSSALRTSEHCSISNQWRPSRVDFPCVPMCVPLFLSISTAHQLIQSASLLGYCNSLLSLHCFHQTILLIAAKIITLNYNSDDVIPLPKSFSTVPYLHQDRCIMFKIALMAPS